MIQPGKIKKTQIRWSVVGHVKKIGFILNTLGNIAVTLLAPNSCLLLDCFVGKDLKENVAAYILTAFRKKKNHEIKFLQVIWGIRDIPPGSCCSPSHKLG